MATLQSALQQAVQFHQAGKLPQAKALYQSVLAQSPKNTDALHLLGLIYHSEKKHDEAIALIQKAITLNPRAASYYGNLAVIYFSIGNYLNAITTYEQLLKLEPDSVEAWMNLGNANKEIRQYDEALRAYREGLKRNPNSADIYFNLGTMEMARERTQAAVAYYLKAIELKPGHAGFYHNLGNAYQKLEEYDNALAQFEKALSLDPSLAISHNGLGMCKMKLGLYDEAVQCYQTALSMQPDMAEFHFNMGYVLSKQTRYQEALACYDRALALKPDHLDAHLNRSLKWLLTGDYERGWPEYDWRLKTSSFPKLDYGKPAWKGEDLNGKTILVIAEQGYGDNFQFIRYLPLLQQKGARVVFACQPELLMVLRDCNGIDQLVERTLDLPATCRYDTYSYLMSLLAVFGTRVDTIPQPQPQLSLDENRLRHFQSMLAADSHFKVGVVWASKPSNLSSPARSCTLSDLAPLFHLEGTSFYSLQKGDAAKQLAEAGEGFPLANLDAELRDFADTATVIAQLDLVITVDTAVAHLAGILGKPVWVMLPHDPDWRWLLNREDSPWYPTARLFRQPAPKAWPQVIEAVSKALREQLNP